MTQIRDEQLLLSIALVFKELRENMGVSQHDVYVETGVHIGRIEACTINPSVCSVSVLLKYFKIKLSEFYLKVEDRELFVPYNEDD